MKTGLIIAALMIAVAIPNICHGQETIHTARKGNLPKADYFLGKADYVLAIFNNHVNAPM